MCIYMIFSIIFLPVKYTEHLMHSDASGRFFLVICHNSQVNKIIQNYDVSVEVKLKHDKL